MKRTDNYNLPIIELDDYYDIEVWNEGNEKIDTVLSKNPTNPLYPPLGLSPCKIDGVTDDSDNFQAIIDFISSNGGGEITLPRGTMMIRKEISLKSNIIISGQGEVSKITTDVGSSQNGLNLLKAFEQNNIKIKNIQVRNLGFGKSGAWSPQGTFDGVGSCILAVGCDNFVTENCNLYYGGGYNGGEGVGNVYYSCCTNSKIINNTVKYCDNGICVDSWYNKATGKSNFYNSGVIINGNNVSQGTGRGIVIENASNILNKGGIIVSSNTITNMAYAGIQGNSTYNCIVSNNIIDGDGTYRVYSGTQNTWYGIEFLNATNECVISNNNIKNCGVNFIRCFEAQDLIITNNVMKTCTNEGVFIKNVNMSMNNVIVNNNSIYDVTSGITIKRDSTDTCQLKFNQCCNNIIVFNKTSNGKGILFNYHTFSKCDGNEIIPLVSYNNSTGIECTGTTKNTVNNNVIYGCTIGIGLYGDNTSISNNNLIEACTNAYSLDTSVKTSISSKIRGGTLAFKMANGSTSQSQKCRGHYCDIEGVTGYKDGVGIILTILSSATPSGGTWEVGDRIINDTPVSASYSEWVYYGGSWKGVGLLP